MNQDVSSTFEALSDKSIGLVEMSRNILSRDISDINTFILESLWEWGLKTSHALKDMGDAVLLHSFFALGRSDVTDEKSWDDLVHYRGYNVLK